MASADELILEAEFAFRNVSPGSTDNRKYTARARRYANKVIRKYPTSPAAKQARVILYHLGGSRPITPPARSPHANHTSEPAHRHAPNQKKTLDKLAALRTPVKQLAPIAPGDDSWQALLRKIAGLTYSKKKILAFVIVFFALVIGFMPFLWVFLFYYFLRPVELRNHAHKIVDAFA